MNLNRTIVDESTAPEDWADVAEAIRAVGRRAFPESTVDGEYGQHRDKPRVGRTMGVMAGGLFADKLKDVVTRPADTLTASAVAALLADGLADVRGDWEWGVRPVYVIDLPDHGMAILGVTGEEIESRSAAIVKHGGDDERKEIACPGVDHAADYPLEVGITMADGELQVRVVDVMYRMKMFWEDAGKMAFLRTVALTWCPTVS